MVAMIVLLLAHMVNLVMNIFAITYRPDTVSEDVIDDELEGW